MIRRQRLVWFALGALASLLCSLLATAILNTRIVLDEPTTSYLIFEEPYTDREVEDNFHEASIADRTGSLMRECGVPFFEMTFAYNDHAPTAELPIITENVAAIPCVVSGAEKQGIVVTTDIRWGDPATKASLLYEPSN